MGTSPGSGSNLKPNFVLCAGDDLLVLLFIAPFTIGQFDRTPFLTHEHKRRLDALHGLPYFPRMGFNQMTSEYLLLL